MFQLSYKYPLLYFITPFALQIKIWEIPALILIKDLSLLVLEGLENLYEEG